MTDAEEQLRRLLRAAASAPAHPGNDSVRAPTARWLLRHRETCGTSSPRTVRPVLQGGLAFACLLFLVSALMSLRELQQANQDVFAVPEAALTRFITP